MYEDKRINEGTASRRKSGRRAAARRRRIRAAVEKAVFYFLAWVTVGGLILTSLILTCRAPQDENPAARERAALVTAREEYERIMELYGDEWSAGQRAQDTYEALTKEAEP